MKKILCILLTIGLLASCLSGCDIGSTQQTNSNNTQKFETPTETNLNISNISDYVVFNLDIGETKEFHNEYAKKHSRTVKITVSTASRQNVEFNDLTVNFKVVADGSTVGYGWDTIYTANTNPKTEFSGTLNIPYNGVWEEVFEIQSEYVDYYGVSENPNLKIEIINVSGKAISK